MRKVVRFSVVLTAMLAVAAMGCDSDDGNTGNTGGGADVVADNGGGGGGDTGGTDMGGTDEGGTPDPGASDPGPPPDPCDPNPCASKSAECVGNVHTTYTAPGTCTDNAGTASCEYAVDVETDCGSDTCTANGCVAAGNWSDYTFSGQASWISALAIGGVEAVEAFDSDSDGETDPCCFDFNGDSEIDNALGKLIDGVGGLLGDVSVQALLAEQIQCGSIGIVFEYVGLDDAAADTDVTVNGFYGADTADAAAYTGCDDPTTPVLTQWEANLTGSGVFAVGESNFVPGTATPLISMAGATITGGVMEAGPAIFTLSLPLGDIPIEASISETRIEAPVTANANGKGLDMAAGKLGGVVKMEDLFGALNGVVDGMCACLNLGGPLINYIDDDPANKPTCNKADAGSITCTADEDVCEQLNSFCGAALLFLKADVDLDGNGYADAMSVGLWFSGVAATIELEAVTTP